MKERSGSPVIILALALMGWNTQAVAQCMGTIQFPQELFAPECTGGPILVTDSVFPGSYVMMYLVADIHYQFNSPNQFITVTDQDAEAVIASGYGQLYFTPNSFGQYRVSRFSDEFCSTAQPPSGEADFTVTCQMAEVCDNIMAISACGVPTGPQVAEPGEGDWDYYEVPYNVPGRERLFTFIPEMTGMYQIEVTEYIGGDKVYFSWKLAEPCYNFNWNYLGKVDGPGLISGNYGPAFMSLEGGEEYYILWDPGDLDGCMVDFTIVCAMLPNDDCADAELLLVNEVGDWGWECFNGTDGTTDHATTDGAPPACYDDGPYMDVWYRFNSGAHTSVAYHLFWPDFVSHLGYIDELVEVYEGGCDGNVLHCAVGLSAVENVFGTTPNTDYWIRVASPLGSEGDFIICLNSSPLPPDPCENIVPISGCGIPTGPVLDSGPGVWSWPELDTYYNGTPGREHIYSFTPDSSGMYNIEVIEYSTAFLPGSGTATLISVDFFWKEADACDVTGWNYLGSTSSPGPLPWSGPAMMLTQGVTYYIMWDPDYIFLREVDFMVNCLTPPYDPCGNVMDLSCGVPTGPQVSGPGPGAWSQYGDGYLVGQEQIFSFTPERSGTHRIHVTEYIGDADVAFYWKEAEACDGANWNFFNWHSGTGDVEPSYGGSALVLTAGVEYYIMWDPRDVEGRTIDLTLLCPDCTDEPGGAILPGTECDDGDADTENDVYTAECECAGTAIAVWDCPGLEANIGDPCDDGDDTTGDDAITDDCACVGQLIDCEGLPGGDALPGNDCALGNGIIGIWDGDCHCVGVGLHGAAMDTFTIHPNPAHDELFISSASGLPVNVEVLDLVGQVVLTAHRVHRLDVAGLSAGSYLLSIRDDQGKPVMHARFVKR